MRDCQVIKLPNASQAFVTDMIKRKSYVHDHYLQIWLATVNGKSLKRMLSKQSKEEAAVGESEGLRSLVAPIAQVFFRLSHRNFQGEAMANSQQENTAKTLQERIKHFAEVVDIAVCSSSFVPYYDSLEDKGEELCSLRLSEEAKSVIKQRKTEEEDKG